ncbi:MAG TPA: M17 family peptidase N-terminal domain-containing protein, partial [Novosphingobium sp.]|nr:M17 family peptidase N-terminal domain-containing protein [Novosphingobium sp.]
MTASERTASSGREIGFAAQAPQGAALVVLMESAGLPAGLPLAEAERAAVEAAIAAANYAGKPNEMLSLRGIGAYPRILLAGTGPGPGPLSRQEAAGKAAQDLAGEAAPVALLAAGDGAAMADAALGFALGQYRFDRLRSGMAAPLPGVTVVGSDVAGARAAWAGRHQGLAEGVRFARDLITEPASVIYPESFVERARAAFSGIPGVRIAVLDEPAMRRLG